VNIFLKTINKLVTGTNVTDSAAVIHRAMDVFARNSIADPLYVSGVSGLTVKEVRYHDTSSVNIQANSGAFVEIGTGATSGLAAAVANTILNMKVACTFGEPIVIRKAASAAAALAQEVATTAPLAILNQGQSQEFPVSLVAGDRLWVQSKSATAITAGYLTLNLEG
jgi:hypothetical protein